MFESFQEKYAGRHNEWTYVQYHLQQYCKEFNVMMTFRINQLKHLHGGDCKKLRKICLKINFSSHEFFSFISKKFSQEFWNLLHT